VPERLVIADTGPLVAFLLEAEPRHDWVVEQFKLLRAPFLTCEPVFTEAAHFLSRTHEGIPKLFELLRQDLLLIDFSVANEAQALRSLMAKYQDLPMSLADACLVRMAEIHPTAAVFTLDHHFRVYRKNGRMPIDLVLEE
jgi:predicted nucleic acid-binding protein